MNQPNTGAQPTGAMTLDSAVGHLKAKMAESGTSADDQVATRLNEDGTLADEIQEEAVDTEQTDENNTEVSEGESQTETEEPDTRPIILPDGSQITAEEARKGYLRQADFTKKTQDVAREREAFVMEKQAAVQQINGLYQQLASLQEQEPNWLQLSQSVEPAEYQRQQAYWSHKKNVLAHTQQVIQQTNNQRLQTERANAFRHLNAGEFEPTWKDTKTLQSGLNTVSEYLIDRGLPAEVLDGITNPLFIEIAEESRRYRELQKQKPKAALAVKGKPAPFKVGAKSTASPQTENFRLLNEAFRKTPSVDNAVALERARGALGRR
jgi:hypothetical protein